MNAGRPTGARGITRRVTHPGLEHEVTFEGLDGEYYVRTGSKGKVAACDWRG
ncbi:hypothetical protein [Streptomyces europaeiscabiei]|uniref:hypothetical protein n=1 Tax=Streptomyces europaeiscabiei TaxID=146819 RepID=UPI0038F60AA2